MGRGPHCIPGQVGPPSGQGSAGVGPSEGGAIVAGTPTHTKHNPSPWEVSAPLLLVSVLAFKGQYSPQLVNGWRCNSSVSIQWDIMQSSKG